jgi:asparagine synthase (glutamine-hydrolysing)
MCGIVGYVDYKGFSSQEHLEKMVQTLDHRGPDDFGIELYKNGQTIIGYGQTQLSIIDLSHAGHQPMSFGDYTIVFNGEIYNYKEIKVDLERLGHIFETDSDTEVILHAFSEWGEQFVDQMIGMFALSIYDKKTQIIYLYRDRVGVKPLYYYQKDNLFLFGSELKALMAHPRFEKVINVSVLPSYLNLGYIPAPQSIFKNCQKLLPGHFLKIDIKTNDYVLNKYWDPADFYQSPKLDLSFNDAKKELTSILESAFNYRMVADVPVGVFLSGGYDSTAVAAILQKDRTDKLKTFTIGFEQGNNEAPYAKETAAYLGTDHTEYICTTAEAQAIIPNLAYFYDEPIGDSPAIPTTLVSQLAKKSVTVALSADGGDEIFCGYNSYFKLNSFKKQLDTIPSFLKKPLITLSPLLKNSSLGIPHYINHQIGSAVEALNHSSNKQAAILSREQKKNYKGK